MAIERISGIKTAGYQMSQQAPRQVETVSLDTTDTAVSTDMASKIPTVKNANNAENGNSYENQKRGEVSSEQIKKAVADMNKRMSNTFCQFGIHEGTGRVTIKILDKESKEILKEYPAEETLEMIAKAWELAGIMVDEKL